MKKFVLKIDNITNVDYAHFLGFYKGKCSQLHAHSSYYVSVSIEGERVDNFVVDFKDLKKIVKEVVDLIDHKLVVCKDYVVEKEFWYEIRWTNQNGEHYMELPKNEVFVLDREPSIENILEVLANKVLEKLPENVSSVTLEMQEGLGGKCSFTVSRSLPKNKVKNIGKKGAGR